jgi:hypothetical protein
MLNRTSALKNCQVIANDGPIGHGSDIYFDADWGVRYIVVETGQWLASHPVLISPSSVASLQAAAGLLMLNLTRVQVKSRPAGEQSGELPDDGCNRRLYSDTEIVNYAIEASDGTVGHVADFLFEETTWSLTHVVVDTRNWWPGKEVVVSFNAVLGIDRSRRCVCIDLSRAEIKAGPVFDPLHLPTAGDMRSLGGRL